MKILVAGYGFVGKEVEKLFKKDFPDLYDPHFFSEHETMSPMANGGWKYIEPPKKKYDFCFVCVSTPSKESGECDISAIEDVITNIEANVFVIRSTVAPGTTDYLEDKFSLVTAEGSTQKLKNIVMQPEYVASSSPYPAPLADMRKRGFHVLGGRPQITKKVRKLYESIYPPTCRIMETTAKTAEIIKLLENIAIANKVTLCQEFYEICKHFGINYDEIKEGVFGLDPRFNLWFTYVYSDKRGFTNSHCLPKDLDNMIFSCKKKGYDPKFLEAIKENNARWKNIT